MTVIDDVCKYVSLKVLKNEDDIEVLWLTTKEGIKEHYLSPDEVNNFDDFVDCYSLKDSSLILSDLESQGGLFVIDVIVKL